MLELVAYGRCSISAPRPPAAVQLAHWAQLTPVITRTLHISISNLRVPRSPPAAPRELEDDTITDELDSSQTPAPDTPSSSRGQPFARAFGAATPRGATTGALLLLAALFAGGVAGFQFLVSRANERIAVALAEGFAKPAVLVLTAHPDDEAMFFGPTIVNLVTAGWDVLPVCMSTGGYSSPHPSSPSLIPHTHRGRALACEQARMRRVLSIVAQISPEALLSPP